jgi:hypothetical protein
MFKVKPLKWAAVALPMICILFAAGCGSQASHPNQINSFDAATYDSLLMAHDALASLRTNVPASYPAYTPVFNQVCAAYVTAYASYSTFRGKPTTQAEVTVAIGNLAVAIVVLENALQTGLHPSAKDVVTIRAHARRLRALATQKSISVSDILTELEIAAAVARTIPQASPQAGLAQIVIASTNAALAAQAAAAGQPIDFALLQPVPPIQ